MRYRGRDTFLGHTLEIRSLKGGAACASKWPRPKLCGLFPGNGTSG